MAQAVGQLTFDFLPHAAVVVQPHAGQITSDAGLLPIRQFDQRWRYTERMASFGNGPLLFSINRSTISASRRGVWRCAPVSLCFFSRPISMTLFERSFSSRKISSSIRSISSRCAAISTTPNTTFCEP